VLLWLALLGALPGCGEGADAAARSKGTPVVLVVVDTLRADRLSHAGHGRETAAGLDDFLAEATFFERCWAPSPWTTPSTASILTGLHPLRHGATGHGRSLPPEATTLAERFSDAGWHTAAFSHNQNASAVLGFDQGFDLFEAHKGKSTAYDDVSLLVRRTRRWLDDERSDPFFVWLQPMNVHGPYKVPEPRRAELLGRAPARGFTYYGSTMRAILKEGDVARRERVSAAMLTSLEEQYDSAVRYTLDQVSEVFADLRARGLYDRALIVLTSDHGEELFEHGGFSHGYSLHRELLSVPLYVKLPGQRHGARVSQDVSLTDVTPTIMEVVGQPLSAQDADGRSLLPLIRAAWGAGDAPAPSAQPSELLFHVDWWKRCMGAALQRGRWKLVRIERNYEGLEHVVRLYDIEADPGETEDVAAAHPELVAELTRRLDAAVSRHRSRALQAGDDVLSQMDRQALEQLGYL